MGIDSIDPENVIHTRVIQTKTDANTHPYFAKFVHIATIRFFTRISGDDWSKLKLKNPKWNK